MSKSRLYNVNAIILRRTDFGEADRMVTIFTPDRGKLKLLAKGARKTNSRKAGHIELFMHSTLQVATGRTWGIITQAETVETFRALREDLDKIGHAYYLAELVDKFTEEHDPSYPIFELLLLTLNRLSEGNPEKQYLALRYFELSLLGLAGYQPQVHFCIACTKQIKPDRNYFHIPDGGVLCPTCGETRPNAEAISVPALKILRFLQKYTWEQVANLQLTHPTQQEVEILLRHYISFTLERSLKSVDFLKKLQKKT